MKMCDIVSANDGYVGTHIDCSMSFNSVEIAKQIKGRDDVSQIAQIEECSVELGQTSKVGRTRGDIHHPPRLQLIWNAV